MSLKSRISMAAKALFAPDFSDVIHVELELRRQQLLDAELKLLEAEAEVKFIRTQMDLLQKVKYTLENANEPQPTFSESLPEDLISRLQSMFPGAKVVKLADLPPEAPEPGQKG